MLVLITYDVNTTDAAGEGRPRDVGEVGGAGGRRGGESGFFWRLGGAQLWRGQTGMTKMIDTPEKKHRFLKFWEAI